MISKPSDGRLEGEAFTDQYALLIPALGETIGYIGKTLIRRMRRHNPLF